jgi:hypothetical protein
MRSYRTVRDVLRQVAHWHQELLSDCCDDDGTDEHDPYQPLVEYLAVHESVLKQFLDGAGGHEPDQVVNTWLQYVPADDVERVVRRWKTSQPAKAEDVLEFVLEFDAALVDFYKSLANQAQAPPRVNAVFQNLLDAEEWQKLRNAWAIRDSDSFHSGRG